MRETKTARLCFAGLICVLLCSPAVAQGLRNRERRFHAAQDISSDIQGARFRWRSFYLLSRFEISDIGYNEDFYVPTSDVSSGLTFGISAPQKLYFIPSKKLIFSAQMVPIFNVIRQTGVKSQWSYAYRGDVQVILNHVYFDLYGTQNNQPRTDQLELNHVVTRKDRSFGLNGEYKYSSKTSAAFSGYTRNVNYPLDKLQPPGTQIQQLNHREDNGRISFLHHTFAKTSLLASIDQSRYTFPLAHLRNGKRTMAVVGLDFTDGVNRLHLEAGPGRVEFNDPTQHPFRGILGSLNAGRQATALISLSANASRDVDFSIFADNNFYIVNRGGIELTYSATRKLTLRAGSDAAFTAYDTAIRDSMGVLRTRHDKIIFSSVGWLYRFGRKLRGGFDVGYYERTSNFGDVTQSGIRYVLHLSFTP